RDCSGTKTIVERWGTILYSPRNLAARSLAGLDTRISRISNMGGVPMRCTTALKSTAIGIGVSTALATAVWAQEGGAAGPWRGAGVKPCFGPEGGSFQCAAPAGVVAIRAGRLFDSASGQMLTNQVLVLHGDRLSDVGSA